MSSTSFSKSKAFKEREENAREKLRQVAKQDLVADLSRLSGDTTFSDVLFTVGNVEFQAHTVVLRARAPNFSRHFLPIHASPVSVQTCIQINGLEAAEFEAFLRSAYTEDDFKDYDESSYPWRKQTSPDSVEINHVVNGNEQSENDADSQKDHNGMCTMTHNVTQSDSISECHNSAKTPLDPSIQNFDEQDDVTCTQSDCGVDTSNSVEISFSVIAMETDVKTDPLLSKDEESVLNNPSQCISSCMGASNIESAGEESNCPASCTQNNADSVVASSSPVDHTSQCHTDLVDGLNNMAVDESTCNTKFVCKGTQTLSVQGGNDTLTSLCDGMAERQRVADGTTFELTATHCEIDGDGFQSKQGKHDHTTSNETSEAELESCSCSLGQDLLQLLLSESGSDVTFLVNGGKVKAHKAILCARSNYFSAMLHGDWVEGKTNEIPLIGVTYDGLMTVLKYIYGGTAQVKNDLAVICDTLPLVDMYGLEGLKEVIICTLKIEKCHLFHKPCSECIIGASECLELSELFSLTELKKTCIKWMAKHFDRVLGTKGFTTLPKHLREELLAEIQQSFSISSAVEVLNHCDRLSSCTPLVKWTEPVHMAVSSIQESCLLFIARNFFSMVGERSFHEILKGVGWSIPVLEKIILAVKNNLAIENCCDQLRAILKLKRLLNLRATEAEGEECHPEEVDDLMVSLHKDCVKFIRCNLFKVTRSDGWKRLMIVTQREIKEGAVFSGVGDSGEQRGAAKGRSRPNSAPSSSRPPTRNPPQRAGTDSFARGLGRGSAVAERQLSRSSNQPRPSSARGQQSRTTGGSAPTNKRPSTGRPASAQSNATSGRGQTSSVSRNVSEKMPSSSRTSVTSGNSRMSSSFFRSSTDKKPSSATVPARSKMLSSKPSSNDLPPARTSRQRAGNAPLLAASSTKNSSLLAQGASKGRPSSAASYSAPEKSQAASRPPLTTGRSTNNSFSKSFSREKALSAKGSPVETKKAPVRSKVQSLPNSRQARGQGTRESSAAVASCNSSESLVSTEFRDPSSSEDTAKHLCSTTQASKETNLDFDSDLKEKNTSSENNGSSTRVADETCGSESSSLSQRPDGAQATSAGAENTAVSMSAQNSQDNSLSLDEGPNSHCSDLQCNDSPDDLQFNDSLE